MGPALARVVSKSPPKFALAGGVSSSSSLKNPPSEVGDADRLRFRNPRPPLWGLRGGEELTPARRVEVLSEAADLLCTMGEGCRTWGGQGGVPRR